MKKRANRPSTSHPCIPCGACCASLRVVFYPRELASRGGTVPDDLVQRLGERVAMRGTIDEPRRCVALDGIVGTATECSIYIDRSENCRAFEPSYERGERNRYCDEARLNHGLAPLRPEDWPIKGSPP